MSTQASDIFFGILGLSFVIGLLAFLVWVLRGGLRKGAKLGPIPIQADRTEAFQRTLAWAAQNQYPVLENVPNEKLILNTSGITHVAYVLIGIVLCFFGLLWAALWFVLANGRIVMTFQDAPDGSVAYGEVFGAGTKKKFQLLALALVSQGRIGPDAPSFDMR